ncbi:MAG: hypothetical protein HRT73_14910 [Flavobacteriales bacterium]|nr:hypothetical protein [Flavobacteriales bacterium]
MGRSKKIKLINSYSCFMGIEKNCVGYWGRHGAKGSGGWIGYAVIVGIFIVSFITIVLLAKIL